MSSPRVAALLAEMKLDEHAAKLAGLTRFECACGQVLWALDDARISCAKCFGAFRLKPVPDAEAA
jgi:hypothetical protein